MFNINYIGYVSYHMVIISPLKDNKSCPSNILDESLWKINVTIFIWNNNNSLLIKRWNQMNYLKHNYILLSKTKWWNMIKIHICFSNSIRGVLDQRRLQKLVNWIDYMWYAGVTRQIGLGCLVPPWEFSKKHTGIRGEVRRRCRTPGLKVLIV